VSEGLQQEYSAAGRATDADVDARCHSSNSGSAYATWTPLAPTLPQVQSLKAADMLLRASVLATEKPFM
jgi:hypothetical protein